MAGRDNGFPTKARRKIVLAAVEGYRTAMRGFAEQPFLDVWYAHLDIEQAIGQFRSQFKAKRFKEAEKLLAKAHTKDSTKALGKLTALVDGRRRIISDPPMIVPLEELFTDVQASAIYAEIRTVLGKYRRTLQSDRRHLLEQFTLVQAAQKVVGVGSVGTRARILLMDSGDGVEPLFLQAKEAQPSVLAPYCGRSQYANQGERVVAGQHLMQAESDIFLGWTRVPGPDKVDRDFYIRQLKDWKFSAPIELAIPSGLRVYAGCAGGPWPGRTPAPATASRSPPTSAAPAHSTRRSPTSPKPTPTRTNATTPRSRPPSRTAEPRRPPRSKTGPRSGHPNPESGRQEWPSLSPAG